MPRSLTTRFAHALPMVILLTLGSTGSASAQRQRGMELLVTADGVPLDYPPDGVWRARARQVAAMRARLRSQGDIRTLNAPIIGRAYQPPGAAVAGNLRYPTILYGFADTDIDSLPPPARYDSVFYTPTPFPPRPYTVRTFYDEMSNGLLQIGGQTYGWIIPPGTSARTVFTETCGPPPANVLDCGPGRSKVYQLFIGALSALDGQVDFGQFDNDGPDGIPNSGDDDGVVDVAQFVGPIVGGECGGRGIWAHKFSLANLTGAGPYVTKSRSNSPKALNGMITVDAYHAVSGVGGVTCTDTTQIMGIGTASHELGHGLGLPDLYDVSGNTQGIGEWGIMGSGNYTSLLSPAHHDAWSKTQLGWVVVKLLSTAGKYSLGPVVTGDTVLEIRPQGPNPRGEYFLLENKQALGSDYANMVTGSRRTGGKVGGLLVWHIDSAKVAVSGLYQGNSVNAGSPHGIALVQADDSSNLDRAPSDPKGNRGDAGDPYPGTNGNTAFSKHSFPTAVTNGDAGFSGFAISNIHQDVGGAISFQLGFASIIRPSDTLGYVKVSSVAYHRFYDVLSLDSADTVSVDSPDSSIDGGARYTFVSWSDGGAQTHPVTPASIGDSLVATLDARYRLRVSTLGTGTVTSTPDADIKSGAFYPAGSVFKLVAAAGPGNVFDGWSGDTVTTRDTLVLTMRRPYQQLLGRFVPPLAAAAQPPPAAIMGAAYQHDIDATGGTGRYLWSVVSGRLPPGLTFFTNGHVSGTPEATGSFPVTLRVASGNQLVNFPLTFTVNAPTLIVEAAVDELLNVGTPLTDDQLRYLDLLGNRNGRYDLGDFLAWVKKTGVHPPAAIMARALAATKAGKP